MCVTLSHIQNLKKNFSMELTIIEIKRVLGVEKLVSTLVVQMGDFQKRLPRLRRTSEWMRRTYVMDLCPNTF